MAIVIPTINLKGGVAKTTTTVGLAEVLAAEFKKKVLLIDLDPQTSATTMLIGDRRWKELNKNGYTLAALFEEALDPDESKFILDKTLQKNVSNISSLRNLDLLPSSLDLINIQDVLAKMPTGPFYSDNPIEILKKAIRPIKYNYDYILIDCPPNMGIITLNGLRIANGYIIPAIPDVLSTYGIPYIVDRIEEFSNNMDIKIEALGIVVTKFKEDSKVHKDILGKLKKGMIPHVFKSIFKESNQIAKAADYSQQYSTFKEKWEEDGQYNAFCNLAKDIIERYEG
ncbi:ParA family protein [Ureibacillus chungkukjangi]|uniref:Chromosome partitioning protein n=1 Tax=Ureibacillus chungkukjangi TaxID=1202712 RepID=A0A318TV14_9BACL|nr:ParA family protein [Ureibacillus chungkukjangi]PYF08504.1 chromosome partitioning protein [Ureibacillus chungkukjangi]